MPKPMPKPSPKPSPKPKPKQQWFNTLNEALAAESTKTRDLIAEWPLGRNINYGDTVALVGNSGKLFISVYRDRDGLYERPIHYSTRSRK